MRLIELADNGLAVLRARWYLRDAHPLGARVRVWGRPVVRAQAGRLVVGDRVRLVSTMAKIELAAIGGTLELGAGTYLNYGCSIEARRLVRIGRGCNFGTHCLVSDSEMTHTDAAGRDAHADAVPIQLEDNVWLGAWVVVQGGVTIGTGSVIGAGSVVASNVPPLCLAVGVPARVIRQL